MHDAVGFSIHSIYTYPEYAVTDLVVIAEELLKGTDEVAKPLSYYSVYQQYFSELSEKSLNILELGMYKGDSTKIFSRFFKNSKLLSLDLEVRNIDFTGFGNISCLKADQTDKAALDEICAQHAPDGFDIIIDDASHVGYYSLRSYEILFPKLKPGGYYVVEDWGTGYWSDWPDGGADKSLKYKNNSRNFPKRILSHDYGMVGFLKHLVDETAGPDNRPTMKSPPIRQRQIEFLHIYLGQAILKKAL